MMTTIVIKAAVLLHSTQFDRQHEQAARKLNKSIPFPITTSTDYV